MSRVTLFVDVIVPLGVPNKYTYRVPVELNDSVETGKRVLVQFGKSKIYTGIIYHIHEVAPKAYQAKYIEAVLDEKPILTNTQLKFWDWLAYYYCANPGDVMNAALPSGLKLSSTSHIQINANFNFEEIEHHFFTDNEHNLIELLHANPNLSIDEVADYLKLKNPQSIINKLLKKNAIEVFEEVKNKYKPKLISLVQLSSNYQQEVDFKLLLEKTEKKAFKQAEALLAYIQLSKSKKTDWIKKTDLSKSVDNAAINALIKKEIFIEKITEADRILFEHGSNVNKKLSSQQQNALLQIQEAFNENKITLLKGVTGSGKTEVYIKLIQQYLSQGKQVLYLIPEIALTTQLITRLRAVFGEIVGVYHSRFSENERVEIWNNILNQEEGKDSEKQYKIILAARSGLFLPYKNLGLIIIDEEHDFSYKQQAPSPRYHARDSAIYLATLNKAKVLLGTATPTFETHYNCIQGKYKQVNLQVPYTDTGDVEVEICDLKYYESIHNMKGVLTPPLFNAISFALENKQQIILFQNRRGFAPYTQCNTCATIPYCKNCDVSLIYHKYLDKLSCHYCGYTTNVPKTCAACGGTDLRFKGLGTEKIEEDIELLFPNAKIARMDLDTTRSKYAHKQLIDEFESGAIDILIGTQMVTKGLDFENVSIVGVINVDSILNFPDFRSFEKAYQLITQLKGRAGRKKHKGKLFIQTTQPQHAVLKVIQSGDGDGLYTQQLIERETYHYPPFYRLIELSVISKNIDELNHLSQELANALKKYFGGNLLGPEFPMIPRIKNSYYKKIIIKLDKTMGPKNIRELIQSSIVNLHAEYKKWQFFVQTNVDPY